MTGLSALFKLNLFLLFSPSFQSCINDVVLGRSYLILRSA